MNGAMTAALPAKTIGTVPTIQTPGAGKRAEFERYFRETNRAVFSLAYRILGNRAVAEDLTQEAYVRAWQAFGQYRDLGTFRPWINRILINLTSEWRRRNARQHAYSLNETLVCGDGESEYAREIPADVPDMDSIVLSTETRTQVYEALMGLPESYRVAVTLAHVEDKSYQEISEIIGCPIGTVRSRVHRGSALLRRRLAGLNSRA